MDRGFFGTLSTLYVYPSILISCLHLDVSAGETMSNTKVRLRGNGRMKERGGGNKLIKFGGMNSPSNGGGGFQVQFGTGKNAMKGQGSGRIQMGGSSATLSGGGGRNFQIHWGGGNGATQGNGGSHASNTMNGGGFSMGTTAGGRWQTTGGTIGNGGKVNDGTLQSNGYGDSRDTGEMTDGHLTGASVVGSVDGSVVDEHRGVGSQNADGNVGTGLTSSVSRNADYGRYSSAGHDNELDHDYGNGNLGGVNISSSINGPGSVHGAEVDHGQNGEQNNGMNAQNGNQNDGMNDQSGERVEGEMGLERGETMNNGHQHIGDTGIFAHNVPTRIGSNVDVGKITHPMKVNNIGGSQEIVVDEASKSNGTRVNDGDFQGGSKSESGGVVGQSSIGSGTEKNELHQNGGVNSEGNDISQNNGMNGQNGAETMVWDSQESRNNGRVNDVSRVDENSGTSLTNAGDETGSKGSNEAPSDKSGSVVGATNDGVALKGGGLNAGDTGSRLGDGVKGIIMGKNSNGGDIQEGSINDQRSRMVNVDQSDERGDTVRLDDQTKSNTKGSPGIWVVGKKNNISRHDQIDGVNDSGNNGSLWVQLGNISGTYDHKGIWKWGKKNNITKYHRMANDSIVGDGQGNGMIRDTKSGTDGHYGIMKGEKQDITGHRDTVRYNSILHGEKIEHSHFNKSVTAKKIRGSKDT